jgi:hypothetical protein
MNQKENFIKYLTDSTINDGLIWENIKTAFPVFQCITNPDMVSHIYRSNTQGNDIYFIIQKNKRYFSDLEQYYEQFSKFLLVFDNNDLVYSIYENEVSENMLNVLLGEIREKQENIFYENFMNNVPGYIRPKLSNGPMFVTDNDFNVELRSGDDSTGENIDIIPPSSYRVEDNQLPGGVYHGKKERDNLFFRLFQKGV